MSLCVCVILCVVVLTARCLSDMVVCGTESLSASLSVCMFVQQCYSSV